MKLETVDKEIRNTTDEEIEYIFKTFENFFYPIKDEYHSNRSSMDKKIRLEVLVMLVRYINNLIDEESYSLNTDQISFYFKQNLLENFIDINHINSLLSDNSTPKKHIIYVAEKVNRDFLFSIFKEIYQINRLSITYTDDNQDEIDNLYLPIIYIRFASFICDLERVLWITISEALKIPYSTEDSAARRKKQVKIVLDKMKTKVLIVQDIQSTYFCSVWNQLLNLAEELDIIIIGLECTKKFNIDNYDDIAKKFEIIKAPKMPHSFIRQNVKWI